MNELEEFCTLPIRVSRIIRRSGKLKELLFTAVHTKDYSGLGCIHFAYYRLTAVLPKYNAVSPHNTDCWTNIPPWNWAEEDIPTPTEAYPFLW